MKATLQPQVNGQKEVYTYVVLPLEALQQTSEQGVQSLTVAQNVILKALPDGNITQQIQPLTAPENVIFRTLSNKGTKKSIMEQISGSATLLAKPLEREKQTVFTNSQRLSVIEENNSSRLGNGVVRKSVILKSGITKSEPVLGRAGVRYLKCRSSQISDVGYTRTKQSQTGSFKCSICGQVFNKMVHHRTHMQAHRDNKKYKCDQCSASYNVEDNLKLHMAMHTKGEPICPICNRKFQRMASLKAHIIIHEVDEIFMCVECLAEYETEDDLNKHMESHKKEKVDNSTEKLPLECSFCSHTFQDSNQYKEHISFHIKIKRLVMNGKKHKRRVNTNKDYPYKCEVCKKSFAKYCLLERHMRIHSGEKPFACHLCDRAFNQKGTLQIHLARHSGIKPFQCTLCPAKFCQKGNLRVHVQKTHIAPGTGEKVHKCTMCTCIFKRVSSLNAHITRAHATEKQDAIADVLEQLKQLEKQLETNKEEEQNAEPNSIPSVVLKGNVPKPENNAIRYVRLVDSSIEGSVRRFLVKQRKVGDHQWYICSFCTKEFKKPSDLIRHIRVHTREKPFKCKYCDQAFSLKSTLTTHMTTHIGKRQYQCVFCSKAFTSIRSMNAHLKRHEKRSQQFMCSTCNTVFSTLAKAKMHMELHKSNPLSSGRSKVDELQLVMQEPMVETPNGLLPVAPPKSQVNVTKVDSNKSRPHKCHCCDAAFTKGVHLKRHMLIHSGERKFKCYICSKSFYSSYALKEHLQFHSGERNYSCKVCSKKFVTNAILKRHSMIHNSSTPYICPYCRKRFKSIMLCRRHIKIHRREFSIQIHALNETGELQSLQDADETSSLDLSNSLSDNLFSTPLVDPTSNLDISIENLSNNTEIPAELTLGETSSALSIKSKQGSREVQQNKDNSTLKILYTDENGIIISTNLENDSQDGNSELQNALSQQLYQATTLPQNFADRTNLGLLAEPPAANELNTVEDAISTLSQETLPDESVCPTVYINCEGLPAFTTASLYNACLAQLKNNDPLLMSGINEIQDPNILFSADSTLNQIPDSQLDSQALDMLMPTFTLYNNMAVSANTLSGLNASFPNMILSNIEDYSDSNQAVLPGISEISKKSDGNLFNTMNMTSSKKSSETTDTQNLEVTPSIIDLNDDTITSIHQENAILSNLLYSNTNQIKTNSNVKSDRAYFDTNSNSFAESSAEPRSTPSSVHEKVDFACSYCKQTLKCMQDLKLHKCAEKANFMKKKRRSKTQNSRGKPKTASNLTKSAVSWGISLLKSKNISEAKQNKEAVSVPLTLPAPATDAGVEYKCIRCDKVSDTKNAFARHLSTHKEKKGRTAANNTCSYCSKNFKKRSDLERHIRTHTGEKPFGCDKCGKSFSLKSTLEAHCRTHNPGGNKDFSCAVCSSYFSSKSSLRVHMLTHTGVKPYQCSMCPEKFRTSGHRKSHMTTHLKHIDGKKSTESKTAKLNNLLASIVMDSQNPVQLTQETAPALNTVQASTESRKDEAQLLMQEPDKDTLYANQTIQVDPLFLQQLQLNTVLLQDNSEDLSFVQVDINNDGQITNMKTLLNSAANDISNFNDPLLYETVVAENVRPHVPLYFAKKGLAVTKLFVCHVCNKKYSTKAGLTKHKRLHGASNLFKCTKCNSEFDTSGDLDNHLKLHSGYRPYCCQLCANTFSQERNLKTHMRRIHGLLIQS